VPVIALKFRAQRVILDIEGKAEEEEEKEEKEGCEK
jgi:hypothetical protein